MKKYGFLIAITYIISSALPTAAAPANSNDASSPLILQVDQFSDPISSDVLNSWLISKNKINLSSSFKSELENYDYCPVNKFYCSLTLTENKKRHFHFSAEKEFNTEAITAHLEDLARKVNRDPSDAKFSAQDGKIVAFAESQNGITLDTEKSKNIIIEALSKNPKQQKIDLAFESKKPTINYADINNLGISSLIGEGSSNFKGSPVNRIKNIKVATERFNGLLIKPGEEFSFVKNLGDVDADHGYFPELVIKKNVTEPEFGGGICQVSSTAFRAAIYSGLKITARRNHAYPVSYYNPQGMDSTVYVPQPDLKFVNNTPGYILIQTKIVGTQLYFDFYGTDDGRKTTVDGPYITEKQPDGALKATFTQFVVDKDGNQVIKDVFNSNYLSPYKFPHPGGPVLSVKPANWSDDEWKDYKKTVKELAKVAAANQ